MPALAQAAAFTAGSPAETVAFVVLAVLALGSALAVISMRNVVHAALMLVINLLSIAGLYLTLEAAFLSIVQILVYAGAIMVLFLFVVMLLGVDRDDALVTRPVPVLLAVGGASLLAVALMAAFVGPYTSPDSVCGADVEQPSPYAVACVGLGDTLAEDDGAGVAFVGERLFSRYTYAFELSALLLTVATIGAVVLARRKDLDPEDLAPQGRDPQHGDGDGLGPDSSADAQRATDAADAALVLGDDDEREG